jgi:dihydrofolate reductase
VPPLAARGLIVDGPSSTQELDRVFKEKFDLLLGRKTYEIFAAYWPYYDDASHGGIAKLFNDIKKYAVSRSGEVDTSWAGSVLLRDIADVKRLKQEDGPNLVTQGRPHSISRPRR